MVLVYQLHCSWQLWHFPQKRSWADFVHSFMTLRLAYYSIFQEVKFYRPPNL